MKKSDFFYVLPERLIAQTPLPQRDASRLLMLDKIKGEIRHGHFADIIEKMNSGDCLVVNNSRVIPARLLGQREDTGAAVEVLLLRDRGDNVWECLTGPGKKGKVGVRLQFGEGRLVGEVRAIVEGGNRLIHFAFQGIFLELLETLGQMPLPPYIREKLDDPERYQTVYAKVDGSAAAPTAGLHVTPTFLEQLQNKGVIVKEVTLHVGLGTFRPVKEADLSEHKMHSEYAEIPLDTAEMLNACRAKGGQIVALGTTTCRTLESFSDENGRIEARCGWTDIFIYPGYNFKVIDALITNFHLPESTLLMLVSAFAGRENVLAAYREAIKREYRFFSFGDAMYIG